MELLGQNLDYTQFSMYVQNISTECMVFSSYIQYLYGNSIFEIP